MAVRNVQYHQKSEDLKRICRNKAWTFSPTARKALTLLELQPLPRVQLGQLLLQEGLISELQLLKGLHYHKSHGIRLGEALLTLKYITERALKMALAKQLNIKLIPPDYVESIPPNLTGYIAKEYAWKHKVCTIRRANDHLMIVMDDPTDTAVITSIHDSTKLPIMVSTAPQALILDVLQRLYGPPEK